MVVSSDHRALQVDVLVVDIKVVILLVGGMKVVVVFVVVGCAS